MTLLTCGRETAYTSPDSPKTIAAKDPPPETKNCQYTMMLRVKFGELSGLGKIARQLRALVRGKILEEETAILLISSCDTQRELSDRISNILAYEN